MRPAPSSPASSTASDERWWRGPRRALLLAFTITACVASKPSPTRGVEPIALRAGGSHQTTLSLASPGEAELVLEARSPGAFWGDAGAESVTLAIELDGVPVRHTVWAMGDTPVRQAVQLGALSAGPHVVALRWDAASSRARNARVELHALTLRPHPEPLLARHAPIFLGREDSSTNDLPVLTYAVRTSPRQLKYFVIYTNEDGGSGKNPLHLMLQSGRLVDIEWTLEVDLDDSGAASAIRYQGASHRVHPFRGSFEGTHPILRVATINGLFSDDSAPSAFRFQPSVRAFDERAPPEGWLDAEPWIYQLWEAEGLREGKIDPTCTNPDQPWAIDCYLYVDVAVTAEPLIWKRRLWGLEAKTQAGVFRSEGSLGLTGRMDRSGQVRVAIPVGRGAVLESVRAYAVADDQGPFRLRYAHPRGKWVRQGKVEPVFAIEKDCGALTEANASTPLWP